MQQHFSKKSLLFLFLVFVLIISLQAAPEVTINQGRLIGFTRKTYNNKMYYNFLGIPYAKPPVGLFRFKAPQAADKWTGVFNATKEKHMLYPDQFIENCLTLNVYTKSFNNSLKPVVFWIPQEGFASDFTRRGLYKPDFFMEEDIVLVTINYRHGIFGFLSFNDPSLEIPGNTAFKDIVMALEWVKTNIRHFGGDPDNVIIFGESTGKASVYLLALSLTTKGLFHKTTAKSRSISNSWCTAAEDITPLAKLFNLSSTDEKSIYKVLMNKSMEEILQIEESTKQFRNFFSFTQRDLGLAKEKDSKQSFLNESFFDLIAKRTFSNVSFTIGRDTLEGTLFDIFSSPDDLAQPAKKDYGLHYFDFKNRSNKKAANKIQEFYFSNKQILQNDRTKSKVSTFIFSLIISSQSAPEVTIKQGRLIGSTGTTDNGKVFYNYLGIPYAKPPLGPLRFKAPQPAGKWTGVFNATKEGSACYSRHMLYRSKFIGSEDCLVLNVFTNSFDSPLKPVLFWIHGGGFVSGSSSRELYGPEFLMEEDIVLVTFNYRFGIFGFLSLSDPSLELPGNAAFKDMVMALKWVKTNIKKFGGDPDNVSIFGESAGAAAVHLLVLSSMAKGLFHKAIAESGSAFNPWCEAAEHKTVLADLFNLSPKDEIGIYKNLINKSMEELLLIEENTKNFKNIYPSLQRRFGSVIEKHSNHPFLNESLLDIVAKKTFNKVPFLIGHNTLEGTIFDIFTNPDEPGRPAGEDFVLYHLNYKQNSLASKKVAYEIYEYYYNNKQIVEDNTIKYRMMGDPHFLYGIFINAFTHASQSSLPVYLYRMSIETKLNVFKKFINVTVPGTSHLDDVGYLFKTVFTPDITSGSKEDIAKQRFVRLWTNFAKFGNPTPIKDELLNNIKWKPVNLKNPKLLNIGENLQMIKSPEMQTIEFWKHLELRSHSIRKKMVNLVQP